MTFQPSTQHDSTRERKRRWAIRANLAVRWISRHWVLLGVLVTGAFVGLAFLAPVLMHTGFSRAANVIYKVFSPACHQMAFRSWFLFGEQSYYPLDLTGIPNVYYFEEYVHAHPDFEGLDSVSDFARYSWVARDFVGNPRMGYKVALCQRDVATYLALLLGGILFSIFRRWTRPLKGVLFIVLSVLPMLVDGGYQLVTYMFPSVLQPHETTPLLRTITGALFGFGLIWLTFPHIEIGMRETEVDLSNKLKNAGVIGGSDVRDAE